jgi:hypothetical protein
MANPLAIKVPKGASKRFKLTVVDANGNPWRFDLADSVTFNAKEKLSDSSPYVTIVVNLSDPAGTPASGIIILEFLPADTSGKEAGEYSYDLVAVHGTDRYIFPDVSLFTIENTVS